MAIISSLLGPAAIRKGAQAMGSAFGLKPKPQENIAGPGGWNQQVQAMHKMAEKGTLNPSSNLVTQAMGSQPRNVPPPKPVNPTASSVRPAMSVKPPNVSLVQTPSQIASSGAYGGVPAQDDPAMVGSRAMLDQRTAGIKNPQLKSPGIELKDWDPFAHIGDRETVERMKSGQGIPDFNAQLKAAQDAYLKTFEPSEDVTGTQAQLDAIAARQAMLQANEQAGEANVADQPIAQTFVTGQQAALQRQLAALMGQEAAKAVPLSAKLASFQAQREAQQKRAEAELKFATPQASDFQTVGEGQSIVDPRTGRVVFQGTPKAKDKPQPTASIQEYEYAKANGYEGSFTDYQTEEANRRALATPASQDVNRLLTPAELQLYGAPAGTTFADVMGKVPEKPLSGEAAKVYSIATTIKPEIEQVKALLKGAGRLRITQILSGLDPAASRLIDQVADKVGRLRSGGAINQDEAKRFKEQILRAGDILTGDTTSAMAALDALAAEADSVASNVRSSPGQQTSGQGDDLDAALDSVGFKKVGSGTGNARIVNLDIGGRPVKVAEPMAVRLAKADADFFKATGQHIRINEGFRTHERQAELYAQSKAGKIGRAAPPGKSFHETGLAIDVQNWKEAEKYLRKYGLKNELADDRNHFSLNEFS